MNPEYQRARFLVSQPQEGLPPRFGIVTTCNPNGVLSDEAQNLAATERLRKQLEAAERVFFPVIGCSPDLVHQELGFGVVCQTPDEVVELGRSWQQEAVFWIESGRVHLLPCAEGDVFVLGKWSSLAQPVQQANSWLARLVTESGERQ